MFCLAATSFFSIRVDFEQKFLLLTRTQRGFADLRELRHAYERLAHELRPYGLHQLGVLIDVRLAPAIVPEYETEFIAVNVSLLRPFCCSAVLVRATGLAQAARIRTRAAIDGTLVTSSLGAASVHLGQARLRTLMSDVVEM